MKSRRNGLEKFVVALLLLATFPLAWVLPVNLSTSGLTVCFFRTVTGKPCAFCGLTHAFVCDMHGQWTIWHSNTTRFGGWRRLYFLSLDSYRWWTP
jgi:hypothetical protein